MTNISVRCDCGVGAPPPRVRNLGILASLDPVAIDRASYDLINKENTDGSKQWVDHANGLFAKNILIVSEKLGTGTEDYNLILVDEENENSNLFWYISIPVIILLLVVIGMVIFFYLKRKRGSKMANGSLGVSMTTKKEDE